MKYLNCILLALVGLLLFSQLANAAPGGDLNLYNRASLTSRTGYRLTLGNQGSSDSIEFVIAGVQKGTVTSSGFTGFTLVSPTLSSPTISGNLTFSTAAAKIIPGATSLTIRNNADSQDNFALVDAGDAYLKRDLISNGTAASLFVIRKNTSAAADSGGVLIDGGGQGTSGTVRGATLRLYGLNEGTFAGNAYLDTPSNISIQAGIGGASRTITFATTALNRWQVSGAGALTQDATNGSDIIMAKAATGLVAGEAARAANVTSATTQAVPLYLSSPGISGALTAFVATGADNVGVSNAWFKTRAVTGQGSTIVNSGDTIWAGQWYGANGTAYEKAAAIVVTVDGTPGASADMPGAIDFQVSPDGSATPASRLKISNGGQVLITGTFSSSRTTDIGWSVVDQTDNQACNTGCTSACVFGIDNATGTAVTNLVSCAATTADLCVCAGAS